MYRCFLLGMGVLLYSLTHTLALSLTFTQQERNEGRGGKIESTRIHFLAFGLFKQLRQLAPGPFQHLLAPLKNKKNWLLQFVQFGSVLHLPPPPLPPPLLRCYSRAFTHFLSGSLDWKCWVHFLRAVGNCKGYRHLYIRVRGVLLRNRCVRFQRHKLVTAFPPLAADEQCWCMRTLSHLWLWSHAKWHHICCRLAFI